MKDRFLDALEREVDEKKMQGSPLWLQITGATPNLLTIRELKRCISFIEKRVPLPESGIKLQPSLTTPSYLRGLRDAGINRLSLSLEPRHAAASGKHLGQLLRYAGRLGLWCNVDLELDTAPHSLHTFIESCDSIAQLNPSHITLKPMAPGFDSALQSDATTRSWALHLEHGAQILDSWGYQRLSLWTFGRSDCDRYDTVRDELCTDFIGLGPSAYSRYGGWKVVNADLSAYLRTYEDGSAHLSPRGFVASQNRTTIEWRQFARMLYDLKCAPLADTSFFINAAILLLTLSGHLRNGVFNEKGMQFAHEIAHRVITSLPLHLPADGCVENFEEYRAFKAGHSIAAYV
jgi:coproporphyrinogen III oxidase-like Fe-S oxidoreductase